MAEPELLFTEDEWNAAVPDVVTRMHSHVTQYATAISKHHGDHGEAWGTGSYIQLGDRVFILTNDHVARARSPNQMLLHQFQGDEDMHPIIGDHIAFPLPLDLALLPVDQEKWETRPHKSKAIVLDQISLAHTPVETELLTFAGYSGERSGFYFNTLFTPGTTSTSREVPLPDDERFSPRFHLGLDYKPDLAENVVGGAGLPCPPGFSGSAVWNTCFVESKMARQEWSPDLARVTGVVWGWPSSVGCIVATRSEYLRSFLLSASEHYGLL